jgi:hypothetical protein
VYSRPVGSTVAAGQVIASALWNGVQDDIAQALNTIWPTGTTVIVALASIGFIQTYDDIATTTVSESLDIIYTFGRSAPDDNGGARYKRAASEPVHEAKAQSDDGAWWELYEDEVTPEMLGYDGTNGFAVFAILAAIEANIKVISPVTVEISDGDLVTIPGNKTHQLALATFTVVEAKSTSALSVDIEAGARIVDALNVTVAESITDVDRCIRIGDGCYIHEINVVAADQLDIGDSDLDAFIKIDSDDVYIEKIRLENVDKCLKAVGPNRLHIGSFECKSYQSGLNLGTGIDIYVGSLKTHGLSPNSLQSAGRNALNIGDCTNVSLPFVDIADSTEHGIYIAGGTTGHSENITFGTVTTRRTGQCGVKIKSNDVAQLHTGIKFASLNIIDCAYASSPGTNEDALRIQLADDIQIGSLNISKKDETASCYDGIVINGVSNLQISGGNIAHCANHMVRIIDTDGRDNGYISIAGLNGFEIGGDGYHVEHTAGRDIRNVNITGGLLDGVGGMAVSIDGGATFAPSNNYINILADRVTGVPMFATSPDVNWKVVVKRPDVPVPLTARATSGTDSVVPDGQRAVRVTAVATNANDWVVLPTGRSGEIVYGWSAIAHELRTPASSGATINDVDADGTNEAAIPATTQWEAHCVATDRWILRAWTEFGVPISAIVPD